MMHKITIEDKYIIEQIEDIFKCNKLYGKDYISYEYLLNKLHISRDYLDKLLCIMQIQYGMIGRDDTINDEIKYTLLPEIYYDSKWSRIYESFKADNRLKRVLLISDTHIGNDSLYNPTLINNVYEYAIKNNVDCVFHLGDLFEGIQNCNKEEYLNEYQRQIELFMKEYPNTLNNNIMTYSIKGNHDESIDNILEKDNLDLRVLNYLNKSFYMFPKRSALHRYSHQTLDINNFKIKMTHEAYASIDIINPYASDNSIASILDFNKIDGSLNKTYNLLLSGHRHCAMAANYTNSDCPINNLYLTVPSTSNFNIDKCCALIIDFNYDENEVQSINVTSLYSDIFNNIYKNETFNYCFTEKQKTLRKVL